MTSVLIADFDSKDKALVAVEHLVGAGVARGHIDSYPTLNEPSPQEPSSNEKVMGAETRVSESGPMGHLQAIIAKVFGEGAPDAYARSGTEPTQELNLNESLFLSVQIADNLARKETFRIILNDAGALRVAEHNM